jgi:hypothetical protein
MIGLGFRLILNAVYIGISPATMPGMTPEMLERLNPFRDEARKQGIPAADAERWISAAARPCATLSPDGDGPVVGRFGGPLLLPPEMPDPYYPFLASVDCAALPREATDLPLPPDGHLLLFAFAADEYGLGGGGQAAYVPSGTRAAGRAEKHKATEFNDQETQEQVRDILDQYPRGDLRLTINVSLPSYGDSDVPDYFCGSLLREHPRAGELARVWHDVRGRVADRGPLQLGGYPTDEYGGDGFVRESSGENKDEWVLLADWHTAIEGVEGLTIHWPVRWPDLAARRFDQVDATVFWNP